MLFVVRLDRLDQRLVELVETTFARRVGDFDKLNQPRDLDRIDAPVRVRWDQ